MRFGRGRPRRRCSRATASADADVRKQVVDALAGIAEAPRAPRGSRAPRRPRRERARCRGRRARRHRPRRRARRCCCAPPARTPSAWCGSRRSARWRASSQPVAVGRGRRGPRRPAAAARGARAARLERRSRGAAGAAEGASPPGSRAASEAAMQRAAPARGRLPERRRRSALAERARDARARGARGRGARASRGSRAPISRRGSTAGAVPRPRAQRARRAAAAARRPRRGAARGRRSRRSQAFGPVAERRARRRLGRARRRRARARLRALRTRRGEAGAPPAARGARAAGSPCCARRAVARAGRRRDPEALEALVRRFEAAARRRTRTASETRAARRGDRRRSRRPETTATEQRPPRGVACSSSVCPRPPRAYRSAAARVLGRLGRRRERRGPRAAVLGPERRGPPRRGRGARAARPGRAPRGAASRLRGRSAAVRIAAAAALGRAARPRAPSRTSSGSPSTRMPACAARRCARRARCEPRIPTRSRAAWRCSSAAPRKAVRSRSPPSRRCARWATRARSRVAVRLLDADAPELVRAAVGLPRPHRGAPRPRARCCRSSTTRAGRCARRRSACFAERGLRKAAPGAAAAPRAGARRVRARGDAARPRAAGALETAMDLRRRQELVLTDAEFRMFCELVRRHCGLHFGPDSRFLLEKRLARRVDELDLGSFAAYHYLLRERHGRRPRALPHRSTSSPPTRPTSSASATSCARSIEEILPELRARGTAALGDAGQHLVGGLRERRGAVLDRDARARGGLRAGPRPARLRLGHLAQGAPEGAARRVPAGLASGTRRPSCRRSTSPSATATGASPTT